MHKNLVVLFVSARFQLKKQPKTKQYGFFVYNIYIECSEKHKRMDMNRPFAIEMKIGSSLIT